MGLPGGSDGKAFACNSGDLGSIPGLGRSPGEGNGNPLQYPCLENPIDREAWEAIVHRVAKSQMWLSDFTFFFFLNTYVYPALYAFFFFLKCFILYWTRKKSVSRSVMSDSLGLLGLTAHQVPLSMEFSRQEYRSGLQFPSPGDLPNPGIKPGSPTLQADSLPSESPEPANNVVRHIHGSIFFKSTNAYQSVICSWLPWASSARNRKHSFMPKVWKELRDWGKAAQLEGGTASKEDPGWLPVMSHHPLCCFF